MFHSAAVKLTLWYLAIMMAISLIFSGLLYRVSSAELERGVNHQVGYFNNFLTPDDFNNFYSLREQQLNQDKARLKTNLLVFNLLVLVSGGAASYWLARRTLAPIEDSLKSQSRFAADASHELRTPLTAIQTENEVALRNPKLTKQQATDLLKSNLEEVAKLKNLSEGLLRLANNDGRIKNPELVDLKHTLNQAVERQAKTAESKSIKISQKLVDAKTSGDPDSLTELFSILIDNAIKYSPLKTTINVELSRHGKEFQVRIKDQGQGIAATELPNIFDRFYRTDSSRSRSGGGGYGLGLAIAKKITQAHHGHINVASAPDKGSTFTVHLPAA
ncbi:HAMP domain-containing histidine kinase [Candidatus Saccharibacteria bacterium]|nr:HAMP domain-containing histidine kinase [Candidatus Saccharibacteria bacterium]